MRDTNVNIRTTAPNRYEPAVSPAEKGKQIRTRFPRVRPSILLPPSDISSSFSRGPSCPVLPNAFRRCSRVPPSASLPHRACALPRAKRPRDLLSSLLRASSISILLPLITAPLASKFCAWLLPFFTSRHLPPLIPLSSREDARVNTCARAMGEKEHG